jgi:hypothetical protein
MVSACKRGGYLWATTQSIRPLIHHEHVAVRHDDPARRQAPRRRAGDLRRGSVRIEDEHGDGTVLTRPDVGRAEICKRWAVRLNRRPQVHLHNPLDVDDNRSHRHDLGLTGEAGAPNQSRGNEQQECDGSTHGGLTRR